MGNNCGFEKDDIIEQFQKSGVESSASEKSPVPRISSCYISENDVTPQESKVIRIALLGDANCGKSKLVQSMQHEYRLEEENNMTTLDLYKG